MEKQECFILMYKDFETLSFSIDFVHEEVKAIEKLEHFDKAPLNIKENPENLDSFLNHFLHRRCIPDSRTGYKDILKAVKCRSGFELSFKGHGLSLSDHYWYKRKGEKLSYKDINFFINKWDDSFAKCILKQDYEGLSHSDLNVPDVTTPGFGVKGWIYEENGPKLYKLGINENHSEEAIAEVLASRIAKRFFNENEVLNYELKRVGDRYASVSPVMINFDEVLIPLSEYLPGDINNLYRQKNFNKELTEEFMTSIDKIDIPGLKEFFIKIAVFKDLCFVSDLHFGNLSLIQNEKTGQIRIAPLYDLGGAFGSSRSGQKIILNPNKATLMIIYYLFSDINRNWDYSWYDKNKLIGVEDEIRKGLSISEFYTPEIIETIIEVFHHQKAVLDDMADKVNT